MSDTTLLLACLVVFGVVVLVATGRPATLHRRLSAVATLAVGGALAFAWTHFSIVEAERQRTVRLTEASPIEGRPDQGFVTSGSCRSCHPHQYASWHRSYHRTMTQFATPAAVLGDFAGVDGTGVSLVSRGRRYDLERRGDEFWAHIVDPSWERQRLLDGVDPDSQPDPPYVDAQVVLTTGSHHMQTYWVRSGVGREVYNLCFVYLFEQQRWVPREEVFLRPPQASRFFAMWNNSCIDCHSTAGKVGFDFAREVFQSEVAELGISCEACHGPAHDHVAANRNPLRRFALHLGDSADPTIVQPAHLDHRAASEVCGQCHSVTLWHDELEWLAEGNRFRPGGELEATRHLVRPALDSADDLLRDLERRSPGAVASRFWPDGEVRVSGREYSAMIESACYQKGELSCLSCHSMHESDPEDQLLAGMEGDGACLQCHDWDARRSARHTHHRPQSSGSRCTNCHMPHTTYGLLKAIRSHTIRSPSVVSSLETGRPNACNLCHLDRTLAWTAQLLEEWYAIPPPSTLTVDERSVAASLLWSLTGDAGQRALVAWAMGWEPALAVSGRGWLPPYLGQLLTDPYATVRFMAERSLRRLPAYSGMDYDFLSPPQARAAAWSAVMDRWFELPAGDLGSGDGAVMIDGRGEIDYATVRRLAAQRDDRPVFLAE